VLESIWDPMTVTSSLLGLNVAPENNFYLEVNIEQTKASQPKENKHEGNNKQ
jgi:hypothetical protein